MSSLEPYRFKDELFSCILDLDSLASLMIYRLDGDLDLPPMPVVLIFPTLVCRECLTVVPARLRRSCWAKFGWAVPRPGMAAEVGVVGIGATSRASTKLLPNASLSPVTKGLNIFGVSGSCCPARAVSLVGVSPSGVKGIVLRLDAFWSLGSCITLMGVGALPDRARLKILFTGGGASDRNGSESVDAIEDLYDSAGEEF